MKTVSLDYGHSVTARYKMPIYPSENLWVFYDCFSFVAINNQNQNQNSLLIPKEISMFDG